ncbi:hypothetical protein TNCV_4900751 [Trichonephila clavipes]|nr:hypothetical protein TNCV_4900751 [Trichonephila clavipes]
MAVSEFTSQPFCNSPGCTTHHSPLNSPTKINEKNQEPPLLRGRKTRMASHPLPVDKAQKNRRMISQAELNFKIDLQNKFDNLRIDQVAGSSSTNTAQAHDNNIRPSNTTNRKTLNQNTKSNTTGNNNYLPPPVFLKITDDYRIQMKALNDRLPALRSKMTGEYFKLYTDTDDQHHELNQVLEEFKYELVLLYNIQKKVGPLRSSLRDSPETQTRKQYTATS